MQLRVQTQQKDALIAELNEQLHASAVQDGALVCMHVCMYVCLHMYVCMMYICMFLCICYENLHANIHGVCIYCVYVTKNKRSPQDGPLIRMYVCMYVLVYFVCMCWYILYVFWGVYM